MKSNSKTGSKKTVIDTKRRNDKQVAQMSKMPSNVVSTISQNKLKEIRSYFDYQNVAGQKSLVNESSVEANIANKSLDSEAIIDSVMRKVIELNRDKLTDASLLKVLTSVYLDAKSKLEDNVSKNSVHQNLNSINSSNISLDLKKSVPTGDDMPISDENFHRLREKAEFAVTATHDSTDKLLTNPVTDSDLSRQKDLYIQSNNEASLSSDRRDAETTEKSKINGTLSNGSQTSVVSTVPPALTPMAFGSGQDAHLLKQEENRRQWKAALDEQLKEQQLKREKRIQQTQRKGVDDKHQEESLANDLQHVDTHSCVDGSNRLGNVRNHALVSHPSASHFLSSDFSLPDSTVNTDFTLSHGAKNQSSKLSFNRVRGFTQQIYNDSIEAAERAKLAHETRLINLKQIEERRRQKEEEKARLIMEEKMEEERIARERLRLQQMAELENARKKAKDVEEFQRTQYLYESLVRAQEEAKLNKVRKNPCYSEINQNNGFLEFNRIPKSESHNASSLTGGQNKITNPAFSFTSTSTWNVSDSPSYNNHYTMAPAKSSFAVQTSFLEDIGIQTESVSTDNSENHRASNNTEGKNGMKGTATYKLTPSDSKLMKNYSNKAVNQTKLPSNPSRQNRSLPTDKNIQQKISNVNKKETLNVLKSKQNSKIQPRQLDVPNNNNDIKSTGEQSVLSSSRTLSSSLDKINALKPGLGRTVQDGNYFKSRIPVPISTTHSITMNSLPRQQVATTYSSSKKTSYPDNQNPYGPLDLIRTYDVLNPNVMSHVALPVSTETENTVTNTKKTDAKDPLVNPNSINERPINRQDTILQQLSEIRKGLQLRQMLYESGTYEDDSDE
ncbi:unnamed protein product [Trichobilharzia szidati]|nr:unnamed protein product [Trichobilharzia szidati]